MKTILAVARREILEKWFVVFAALVIATLPFALPIVLRLEGTRAVDVRNAAAMILGLGISAAVAAGMGSSIFAGELAARRMSFHFSRPISAFDLWAGKLAAAALLVAIPFLVVYGPSALIDGGPDFLRGGRALAVIAGSLIVILFLVNHISTMIRSRSWVGFVDLGVALVIGAVLARTWAKLRRWSYEPPIALVWILGIAVAAILLWSSYRAVARGRTSLRAAHAALSASLWSALGGVTVALVGYAAWVLAAPPSSFPAESMGAAGSDGWLFLTGRPRGAQLGILYDTRSSRFERLATDEVAVSRDGRMAAWVERGNPSDPWTLFTRRLDLATASRDETKISFSSYPYPLLLSPDGSRVAAVESGLLTVSEIGTGRTLASAQVGRTAGWRTAWFAGSDRVRMLRHGTVGIESIDFDLATRTAPAVHADPSLEGVLLAVSTDAERLILRESLKNRMTLRDARTLDPIATLQESLPPSYVWARFLRDGMIVLAFRDQTDTWLETFSADGSHSARLRVGDRGTVQLGGQPADGKIYLSFHGDTGTPSPSGMANLLVADVQARTISDVTVGLHPLWEGWFWPRTQLARPGSESSRLFRDERGSLVRFDPATGERKVILPGS